MSETYTPRMVWIHHYLSATIGALGNIGDLGFVYVARDSLLFWKSCLGRGVFPSVMLANDVWMIDISFDDVFRRAKQRNFLTRPLKLKTKKKLIYKIETLVAKGR